MRKKKRKKKKKLGGDNKIIGRLVNSVMHGVTLFIDLSKL